MPNDADEIKGKAQAMLVRAGERAESLAAAAEARRYFEQAAELTDDPSERAALLDRARARWPRRAADPDCGAPALRGVDRALRGPGRHARRRARIVRSSGESSASPGVSTRRSRGMERAFDVISTDEPDEDLALLAARLSLRLLVTAATSSARAERAEFALDIAEAYAYPTAFAIALRAKAAVAQVASTTRRPTRSSSMHCRSHSSTTSSTRRALLTSASPTCRSTATSTPTRSATSTSRSRWHGDAETARASGQCSPNGRTRCSCSVAGTRCRRRATS